MSPPRYYNTREADQLVCQAAGLVGLGLAETGALGKRTRYQVKDVAQFALDLSVEGRGGEQEEQEVERSLLARDVRLEDDLRLDKIQFTEDRPDLTRHLTGLQQAVILAMFAAKLRNLPTQDALTTEEVGLLLPLPLLPPSYRCCLTCGPC